ncbi:MAG: hypothetical protein ACYTKD_23405, partial [Planctomycetota bacterium]
PPISGLSLEEKPITLYSGSVKPLRVLHHRWRVQRVLRASRKVMLAGRGQRIETTARAAAARIMRNQAAHPMTSDARQ